MHNAGSNYWANIARNWAQVGPPLRPSPQDIAAYADAIRGGQPPDRPRTALVLGVTSELYHLPWPPGTRLLAVDRNPDMIEALWPGPPGSGICADWTNLPLGDSSCDVALCDGGLHLLSYPTGQGLLADALRRILAPGGLCVFRLFVPPAIPDSADDVLGDLLAGRIANLNVLKVRLAMALQQSPVRGVQLCDVWNAVDESVPDLGALAARLGWPTAQLVGLTGYRGAPDRYRFVSISQACRLFCDSPGGFAVEAVRTPTYELGERFPILVLRRNA